MNYISVSEYLMGRVKLEELTDDQVRNLNTIVPRANSILEHFGSYRKVNSGFRTREDQQRINPRASMSKHMECAAVDLEDKDGKLKKWCMANLSILSAIGLWMENPTSTPTWCHLQSIAPKSGSRVFNP